MLENKISAVPATMAPRMAKPAVHLQVAGHGASRASEHPTWKRVVDVTLVCAALPVLVLVMLCIAGAIKVLSPGPVFFKQARVGHRRKRFMCWKFRTMKLGADETVHQRDILHRINANAPMAKLDGLGDPRLIPGGAFLRATGLDELPQLINVWRGEMSLVGPRPSTTYEFECYRPAQFARFDTVPGLTGLWQVSGKNRTTFNEMVELDLRYNRIRSLWCDVTIMTKTFSTVAAQVLHMYCGRPDAWCSRTGNDLERSGDAFR